MKLSVATTEVAQTADGRRWLVEHHRHDQYELFEFVEVGGRTLRLDEHDAIEGDYWTRRELLEYLKGCGSPEGSEPVEPKLGEGWWVRVRGSSDAYLLDGGTPIKPIGTCGEFERIEYISLTLEGLVKRLESGTI